MLLQDSLRSFAHNCQLLSRACHSYNHYHQFVTVNNSTDPADHSPVWMLQLTKPAVYFDTPQGLERVQDLLAIRHACQSCGSGSLLPSPTDPRSQRQAAFELAQELPFFDRDIASVYLEPGPDTPEYMLHVAHSILSLSPTTTTLAELTSTLLPAWREKGLLHVLAVAITHLPHLADWKLAQDEHSEALANLLKAWPHARSYADTDKCIAQLVRAQSPGAHGDPVSLTLTLERLAVLMGVKSNAPLNDPKAHSLSAALSSFPRPEQCGVAPELIPQLWSTIKPAIERALPPSSLRAPTTGAAYW